MKEAEREAAEPNRAEPDAIGNGDNAPLIDLTTEDVAPVEDVDQCVDDSYDPSHWGVVYIVLRPGQRLTVMPIYVDQSRQVFYLKNTRRARWCKFYFIL